MASASSGQSVTCVAINQEGTFVAMGFENGFGVFGCHPFAERYRRHFHRSERIPVHPRFFSPASMTPASRRGVQGGSGAGAPFCFQAIQMLHDTNLIALVGNADPPTEVASELHYTKVFQRHKLILWDIRTDSIFLDIDIAAYVSSPLCRGITAVHLFRDGYRAVSSIPPPSADDVADPCNWPEDEWAHVLTEDTSVGGNAVAAGRAQQVQQQQQQSILKHEHTAAEVAAKATMTFWRFIDAGAASIGPHSFDSMHEVGGGSAGVEQFHAAETDCVDNVFQLRVHLATEYTGTFVYSVEGSTHGEECEYRVYQVAHFATSANSAGLGAVRSVSFAPHVETPGVFMAVPASSLGCVRAAYATGDPIAPEPASAFVQAHAAQNNEVGCLAVAPVATNVANGSKPQRAFTMATTSSKAHSVHLYWVSVALDTSAPPALVECSKIKELRRAYANNTVLNAVGVVATDTVTCMAFSPSGTYLAVANSLGTVQIYAVCKLASDGSGGVPALTASSEAPSDAAPEVHQDTGDGSQASSSSGGASALSTWGSWLGSALLSGAKTIVAATRKAVDHELPLLTLSHPALKAPDGEMLGCAVDLAFSTEAATTLLHVATAGGAFATFELDLSASTPSGRLLQDPQRVV